MPTEGLREQFPIRIAKGEVSVATELALLFPGDQSVLIVFPDHHDDIATDTCRCFHFLHVHQEAGVAANAKDTPIRVHDTCGDRAGKRKAHRAKAIRDQASIRLMTVIVTGDPHFVGAHIGQQDVMRPHDLADIPQHLLRPYRALGEVVPVLSEIVRHVCAYAALLFKFKS